MRCLLSSSLAPGRDSSLRAGKRPETGFPLSGRIPPQAMGSFGAGLARFCRK